MTPGCPCRTVFLAGWVQSSSFCWSYLRASVACSFIFVRYYVSPMFVAAPPNGSLLFSRCRFCLTPHLLVKNCPSTRKCCFNAPMPSSTGLPPGSGAKVKDATLIAMASQRWCWQGVAATKPCNSAWEVHGIWGSDGKRKVAVARSLVGVFGTRYETYGWFLPHLASSFPVYYICFL